MLHRSVQLPPHSLQSLNPLEVTLFKQLCNQMNNGQNSIQQLKLLKEQNDMIEDVRNTIRNNKSSLTERSSGCLSQLSTQSNVQVRRSWAGGFGAKGLGAKGAVNKEEKKAIVGDRVEDKLGEVLERCDRATYNCFREIYNEYKRLLKNAEECKYYETLYDKSKKALEEARSKLSFYECRIAELEKVPKCYPVLVQAPSEDKLKYNAMLKGLNDRQAKLIKQQTAFLIKEKLLCQDQKRLQVQQSNLEKQRKQLIEERKQAQEIWDKIFYQMGSEDGFIDEVQNSYKDNLEKQRIILAEEIQQLDKRHEAIAKVIQQLEGLQM